MSSFPPMHKGKLCYYQAVDSDDLSIKTLINRSLVYDGLAVEEIPKVRIF